jgi:hypothetical protein
MGGADASPVASTSTSISTFDPCHDTSTGLSTLMGELVPFPDELWSENSDAAPLASMLMGELVVAFSKELRFELCCVDIVRHIFALSGILLALSH